MARKADAKGGNGNVFFDNKKGTARKYLRNTSSIEKIMRFKQELEVLQDLKESNIPNIVDVIEVNISEDKISDSYVEMKKYDGSLYDLFEITKGNVRYSLHLILPIIKALYTLTKQKVPIYHRDIKPDNILFIKAENGYSLFLTDFGTCFLKDCNDRLTPEYMAIGPRLFIAPEYEIGRVEVIDEKGDIFSIGKVIWCMINGDKYAFLPSNFWFVDGYNLTKRFPNNSDMVIANMIIAACLEINPQRRCSYEVLISQIEKVLTQKDISISENEKYKVKLFQEKRNMELMEIKEKNRLMVNSFSQCYVNALKFLIEELKGFSLLDVLLAEYQSKSQDGIDYTTTNVENNVSHYLYSRTHDKMYISINYNPARGLDKYCNISLCYHVYSPEISKKIKFTYSEENIIMCEHNSKSEALSIKALFDILKEMVLDYITEV